MEINEFVREAVALMDRSCGLVAAYVIGSLASGDGAGAASDIDLLLVTDQRHTQSLLLAAGDELADRALRGPLRGVEAVLYRAEVLAHPRHPLGFEVNVNAGRDMQRSISTTTDEAFWFLLDVAAARQSAMPVLGPPAEEVIGDVADADVKIALLDSLQWQRERGKSDADAALNTCRGLHWTETGEWISKTAAGEAYLATRPNAAVSEALALRRGGKDGAIDPVQVAALRTELEGALARATS